MSETLEQALARCRAERVAKGFPEHLEDASTLERIASIVANAAEEVDHARPS